MSDGILDVRTYRLKADVADAFSRRFADAIGPMLQRHGIKVVHFGPSLIDPDSFCLIRSFASVEAREAQLAGFYGSEEWLEQHDEAVMGMIDSYNVCVIQNDLGQ
jgi:hypothetical protein